MYEYTCRYTYNSGKKNHELLIRVRGSEYRVILGSCTTGLYMCIPTISVLNETDAATIATVIYLYGWIG